MSAQKAYLSVIESGDTADHTTATTWTKVAVAVSIKPMAIKAKDIDITTLESPDEFEEMAAGLADGGEVEVKHLFNSAAAIAVEALFRTPKAFRIRYGAGTKGWKFNGYINEIGDDDVENGKVVGSMLKIRVTGKPVRSDALS